MNLVFFGIIIFIIVFVLLSWFTKTSSKKIAKGVRNLIIILSLLIAVILERLRSGEWKNPIGG